jgi:hypothetical protein
LFIESETKRHKGADSKLSPRRSLHNSTWEAHAGPTNNLSRKYFRRRHSWTSTVIVRRVTQNRMVTKGYRKGVYDRITEGTWFGRSPKTSPKGALGLEDVRRS